jgi:hypothetical protein
MNVQQADEVLLKQWPIDNDFYSSFTTESLWQINPICQDVFDGN